MNSIYEKIWLSSPHMGTNERKLVEATFDSNWIAPLGANVDGFEADICATTGVKHAAVLTSGTAALHLALILLNVQPGDFVICQSMTFSASANPIRYQGAIPVFVDSEPVSWNMDPDALEAAIVHCLLKGKVPRAIIPVHLYGMPANMMAINSIARRYEIPVVEDAAEALGSTYNGGYCGALGTMSILSFNGNKIITTSGGGALLSDNEHYIQQARYLSTQARDAAPHYQHSQVGYNYRMSNVLAAIGRGQMQVLSERVQQRRCNFEAYRSFLSGHPGISFQQEEEGSFSNRWLSTILVDPKETEGITREDIRLYLEAQQIESRPLWKPMHLQPVFRDAPYFGGNVAEQLFRDGLCLPSGSNMTEGQRERVFAALSTVLKLNALV